MKSLVTSAPLPALWLAIAGRVAYVAHLASGHAVTWKASAGDPTVCPGDIVCHDCGQVLWCRAHDPWRAIHQDLIPDHWGATRPFHPASTPFDRLQRVLQLSDECPRGPAGDAVRRAACELVEADSTRQQTVRRRRMLQAIARLERWHAYQPRYDDDPGVSTLKGLTDALRREL